jgi:protein-S-isoprenylcysteine O-methyltransferase Ste14
MRHRVVLSLGLQEPWTRLSEHRRRSRKPKSGPTDLIGVIPILVAKEPLLPTDKDAEDGARPMWRVSNVPVPEPNLVVIAAGMALHRARPWALPGTGIAHQLVGLPLIAGGTYLVVRSWGAAGQVDLTHPERLVTSGPYAISRNPMYVGWMLLHLGVGVAGGNAWIVAGIPATASCLHRQVLHEERVLAAEFTDEVVRYRAVVPRYQPGWRSFSKLLLRVLRPASARPQVVVGE